MSRFRRKKRPAKPTARRQTPNRRRALRTELLEDRRLLAGNIYAYMVGGNGGPKPLGDYGGAVTDFLYQKAVELGVGYKREISDWNDFDRVGNKPGPGWGIGNTFETALGVPDTDFYLRHDLLADMQDKRIKDEDFVVLFGYSLGGEAVLKAARQAHGLGIEIDVLGTIDPVSGGAGYDQSIRATEVGRRWPIRSYNPLDNVLYFFNRWQTVYPYPLDVANGQVDVADPSATISDQGERNRLMNGDLSGRKRSCQGFDYLANNCTTYLLEQDTTRAMTHLEIRTDPGINTEALNAVRAMFESQTAVPELDVRLDGQSVSGHVIQSDGQSQVISWSAQGSGLKNVTYSLRKVGVATPIASNSSSGSGSISFDDLGVGTYQFEITGHAFNSVTRSLTVQVQDDDVANPTVTLGGSRGTIDDQTVREFTWSVSDSSGVINSATTVSGPSGNLLNSSDLAGEFSLNQYGPGYYQIRVTATDADSDWNGDRRTTALTTRSVRVIDDDVVPPRITFFDRLGEPLLGTSTSESHGLDNTIAWSVTDASGLSSVHATLRRDGDIVKSLAVAGAGSISLDEFGIGQFELTLSAADGDADGWLGDTLTASSQAYLSVTNEAPEVFVGGPYAIDEGGLLGLNAVGTDADLGDTETLTYSWDLDNDGLFGEAVAAAPVLTWESLKQFGMTDDGSYPVVVRVEDTFGEQAYSSTLVTVNNSPPSIVNIHAPPTTTENSLITLTGSFTDPGPDDTHTVTVDWGDGSTSEAVVDSTSRTFTAQHSYSDDQPTATAADDYIVEVTVVDDDGDANRKESREWTVETTGNGGIDLPSFPLSLPEGVSGRLEAARVVADPLPVDTDSAPGQAFNHRHLIDYPVSGPFDLDSAWTDDASAAGNHSHTFNLPSQSKTFNGTALTTYFQQSTDQRFSMSSRSTEPNTSGLPTAHNHSTGDVNFTTTTAFTYRPTASAATVLTSNLVRNPGGENHLADWKIWRGNPTWGHYGDPGGFPTQSESCGSSCGTHFFYGGDSDFSWLYQEFSIPSSLHAKVDRGDIIIDLSAYLGGFSNQDDFAEVQLAYRKSSGGLTPFTTMQGPIAAQRSNRTRLLFRQRYVTVPAGARSIEVNLRFHRNGGTTNDGYADNVSLRLRDASPRTTIVQRTGTNEYILPRFNGSLGTLLEAAVTLDAGNETTALADGGQFMHDHQVSLTAGPFDFAAVTTSLGAATQSHTHETVFSPVEVEFIEEADLYDFFLQEQNVLLPHDAVTSSPTFSHSHNLELGAVPIHASTTFTYDVSSTIVRVRNSNPEIASLEVQGSSIENQIVQLSGQFTDLGSEDTHRVQIDWGNGLTDEIAIAPGNRSFTASHRYADDDPTGTDGDTYTITVRLEDDDTGVVVTTRDLRVDNLPANVSPLASFTVNEGEMFTLPPVRFEDDGHRDTHVATVDWGNGTTANATVTEQAGSGLVSTNYAYPDDGVFDVTVIVTDDDGASSQTTATVTVENVPPIIQTLHGQLSGAEGASLTFTAAAIDPGNDTLTYTWDFGDGTAPVNGVDLTSVDHLYVGDGVYTVKLTVTDGDDGVAEGALTVSVTDVAARMLVSGSDTVDEGAAYSLTLGEIVDPGNDPIQGIRVDWGDGQSDTYPGSGVVEHLYGDGDQSFEIAVTLIELDGNELAIASLPVIITNADPEITSLVGPASASEGDNITMSAAATDPGQDPLTYLWDFGDGTPPVSDVDLTDPIHTFADNGTYVVMLTVTDGDGGSSTSSTIIAVDNVAPSAFIAGPADTNEGAVYELQLNGMSDPGNDTVSQVMINWGDGTTELYDASVNLSHRYAEGPATHTISATLVDEDGRHMLQSTVDVDVFNVTPEIVEIIVDPNGVESEPLSFAAETVDPAGPFDVVTYTWDFGDGSAPISGINLSNVSHTFTDDGLYTGTLTVIDEDGGQSSQTFNIDVANQQPQVEIAGVPQVREGDGYTLVLGPITDAGNDMVTDFVVDWGDGSESTYAIGEVPVHTYGDGPADLMVSVSLIDEDGLHAAVAQRPVTVTNQSPTVSSLSGDQSGYEGETFSFIAAAADPGAADVPLMFIWDFGDGTAPVSGSGLTSVEHDFTDDGNFLVTLTVADDDGGSATSQLLVSVANVAPVVNIQGVSRSDEGERVVLDLGNVTDQGADSITEWIVEWGDGEVRTYAVNDEVSYIYADGDATQSIVVHAEDEDGFHFSVGSHSIDILNAAPQVTLVTNAPQIIGQGSQAELAGSLTDAGSLDTHQAVINWGDGRTTLLPNLTDRAFSASIPYDTPGIYNATVTITDNDGDGATAAIEIDVRPEIQLLPIRSGSETSGHASIFEVSIARPVEEDIEVSYLLGGTATPGEDYVSPTASSIVIPAGETKTLFELPTVDDTDVEGLESILLELVSVLRAPAAVRLSTNRTEILTLRDNDPDNDLDGISELEESEAPNSGDGNFDGVPDSQQNHVASLRNSVDARYVTLVAEPGTQLSGVIPTGDFPANAPNEAEFPFGMVEFTVTGISAGAATTVELLLPPGTKPTSFFKYGPTADNPTAHWYDFAYDSATEIGAVFDNDRVTLHFVDGQRGDADLIANGAITDPGAVAVAIGTSPVISAGGPYVVQQGDTIQLRAEQLSGLPESFAERQWDWDLSYDGLVFQPELIGQSISYSSQNATNTTVAVRLTALGGESFLATGSLSVLNLAPNAVNDFTSTTENEIVDVDLLANDTDPGDDLVSVQSDSLTFISASVRDEPITLDNSSWNLDGGTLTFDPGTDFDFLSAAEVAEVIFEYQIQDASAVPLTDSGTIQITVQGENDAPLLVEGNPIIVGDAESFRFFTVSDFVGSKAAVGEPATIVDADANAIEAIMLAGAVGLQSVSYSLDGGETFVPVDLSLLSLESALPLLPDTVISVQPADGSHELGSLQYLPWDASFGSPGQPLDGALLQAVGLLGPEVGKVTLAFADAWTPADVLEGHPFSGTIVLPETAWSSVAAQIGIEWTSDEQSISVSPQPLPHTYPDGPHTYQVNPFVIDSTGVRWDLGSRTISVSNVDPTADDNLFRVVENSAVGTSVGFVSATDPGEDTLTFTITGGRGASAFAVDPDSGEITVANTSQLDFETTTTFDLEVTVSDDDGGSDTADIQIDLINLASISGVVFVDADQSGTFDANEPGIDGVTVELRDAYGNAILDPHGNAISELTSDGGLYLFEDLEPGTYQLHQIQPTGVADGAEMLGSLGGVDLGNDTLQLTVADVDAFDYTFSEIGSEVTSGDTAGIGFWQSRHGQELIASGGEQLAVWLTENFGNVFGDSLAGADGAAVASFYRDELFKQRAKKSTGPAKVEAQFMAVALATYFTSSQLAGTLATSYGFNVSTTGIGTRVVNVGSSGAAFDVENDTELTVLQLLQATNAMTDEMDATAGFAYIYDSDGDGDLEDLEVELRLLANELFGLINGADDN
ncbi:PKD domain-containing protein [Roseiconus nitratireducens]|uniref:PKD domain-containing protein n=1 Tax=Roseiconus nitratireducens TaxID=2605748 RepID=A0A5M6CWH0_9BACT|nr:PKD domain-containing protein [Roseiconus nitratireducens]KAA5539564.1 PKD domain-containing protein [Roseiconus nitratireducens]